MPRGRRNKKPSKGKKATPKRKNDQPWRLVCMQDAVPSTSEKEEGRQDSLVDAQSLVMKKCDKRWPKNKKDINVYLYDTGSNHHEIILKYANEWSKHCAVEFKKCDNKGKSDIRVSFGNNNQNYSMVGTDALDKKHDLKPTMNLAVVHGLRNDVFEKELRRTVLHEFGHVLGLEHEHQSPKSRFKWNKNLVKDKYLELYGWDETKTKANILTRLTEADVFATAWDEKSIMHYGFATEYLLSLDDQPFHEIYDNYDLSELDKETIGVMYPRSDREPVGGETSVPPLPTNSPGGQQVTTTGSKRPAATSGTTEAKKPIPSPGPAGIGCKRPAATSGTTEAKKPIPSPGPALEIKPKEKELRKIADNCGHEWKALLTNVGVLNAQIQQFQDNVATTQDACFAGLVFWRGGNAEEPATWSILLEAMEEAKMVACAREWKKKIIDRCSGQSGSGKPGNGQPPTPAEEVPSDVPKLTNTKDFMEHFKDEFLKDVAVSDEMAERLRNDNVIPEHIYNKVMKEDTSYGKRSKIWFHVKSQGVYETLENLCKAMMATEGSAKTINLGKKMEAALKANSARIRMNEGREPEDYVDEVTRKVVQDLDLDPRLKDVMNNRACITLSIRKCTTIGPPRVGKTCLKNLLIGQQWSQSDGTVSTDAMEAPEWVEVRCQNKEGTFKLLSRENREQRLMNDVAKENYDLEDTSNKDTSSMDTSNMEQEDLPASQVWPAKSDLKQPKVNDKKPEELSAAAKKLEKKFLHLENSLHQQLKKATEESAKGTSLQEELLYFVDTGGQRIFHDIHPVLITSPSVYLVVIDLYAMAVKMGYDPPDKPFPDKVPETSSPKGDDDEHAQLQQFWYSQDQDPLGIADRALRSIHTFARNPVQSKEQKESSAGNFSMLPFWPKVFIVGTHLDLIFKEDEEKRKQCLQAINDKIIEMISGKIYVGYVQFDPKGNCFWSVDNTVAGHVDHQKQAGLDSYLGTMRNAILGRSIMFQVKVPIQWLLFEQVTSHVSQISYGELCHIAMKLEYCRDKDEFDLMLKVFHILGLYYYFKVPSTSNASNSIVPSTSNASNSIVFTDPGILYKATSELFLSASMEIKKTGMKMLDVFSIIRDLVEKKRIADINSDWFTSLLCDLRLMAKIHNNDDPRAFIIPAALPSSPSTENLPFSTEPLVITFVQPGSLARIPFLPSGLFCAFISDLLTDSSSRLDGDLLTDDDWWTMRHDNDHFFRKSVSFHFHGGPDRSECGQFVLSEEDCYIKVDFRAIVHKIQSVAEIARCCIRIRKYLKTRLTFVWHKVYEEYKSSNLDDRSDCISSDCEKAITFGFRCSVHNDIAEYTEVDGEGCYTRCLSWEIPMMRSVPRRQSVWFTQEPYDQQIESLSIDKLNLVLIVQ